MAIQVRAVRSSLSMKGYRMGVLSAEIMLCFGQLVQDISSSLCYGNTNLFI